MVDIFSFLRLAVLEIGQKILQYTFVRWFEEYSLQSLLPLLDSGFLQGKQVLDFLIAIVTSPRVPSTIADRVRCL